MKNELDEQMILFSSFLSGVLLVKKEINYMELATIMSDFECKSNAFICEPEYDCYKLSEIVEFEDNRIILSQSLDDIVLNNQIVTDVRAYLLSLTTKEVRDYFDLESEKNVKSSKMIKMKVM